MPKSDRARSRNLRRSGTRFCLASSNCAPDVRTPRSTYQLSNVRRRTAETLQPKRSLQMSLATTRRTENPQPNLPKPRPDLLIETIQSKLANPERSSNFDLHGGVNQVLK